MWLYNIATVTIDDIRDPVWQYSINNDSILLIASLRNIGDVVNVVEDIKPTCDKTKVWSILYQWFYYRECIIY